MAQRLKTHIADKIAYNFSLRTKKIGNHLIMASSSNEWSIKAISPLEALKSDSHSLEYSIFSSENVYHGKPLLAKLYDATQIPVKNLVAFRPNRKMLHLLIAHVSTTLALENEEELRDAVTTIYGKLVSNPSVLSISKELDLYRIEIYDKMKNLVSTLLTSDPSSINLDEFEEQEIIAAKEAIAKLKGTSNQETSIEVATILAIDHLYNDLAAQKLESEISTAVTNHASEKNIETIIPIDHSSKMLLMMITGGPASGKGSSIAQMERLATRRGIPWKQVIKINTDSYKPLILDPNKVSDSHFYSQLAQEEASLVHVAVQKRIETLTEKNQYLHHIIVDQVFIGKDKIELSTQKEGKVYIIIVSTDVHTAITRSFSRGQRIGRYEHPKGILMGHKNMTRDAIQTLSLFVGKSVFISLVDNNVSQDCQPIPVVDIDLEKKTITIHRPDLLKNFIKKTLINTEAFSEDTLYETGEFTIEGYLAPLTEKGLCLSYKTFDSEDISSSTTPSGSVPGFNPDSTPSSRGFSR